MKKIKFLLFSFCMAIFSFAGLQQAKAQEPCPTGTDIHIANDISGSVDSREFQQSKDFVSLLGANFGTNYGTGNLETRVSISNWSAGSGRFVEYDFPSAGQNYATTISDILSYTTSGRPFRGYTDVYTALLRANEWVNQNPVSGRDVPKVIVLLTDASCGQVATNTSSLATQIKDEGIYIVVLAIDNAVGCSRLSTASEPDKVASPGGYFEASDYSTLQNDAIQFINDLRAATCDNVPPEPFDLTVSLSNFTIFDCATSPNASVDYQVDNVSDGDDFNDNLQISFYDGDPTRNSTNYLFTVNSGTQNISNGGGTFTGNSTDPALVNANTLFAVVNYDGSVSGNEVPLSFSNLKNEITVSGEGDVNNNISSVINRVDDVSCNPFPNLSVNVTNSGQLCDNEIIYFVEICNTGNQDANIDPSTDIVEYAPADFTFIDRQLVGNDPFVGTVLPTGECAVFEYTYNLDSAVNDTNYNYSVDIVATPNP